MNLRQLEIVRTLAEAGTFSAAAERVGLTQSAISQQIRKLEAEVGETLVRRSRPKVELTPAGLSVVATAEAVLREIEDLTGRFSPEADERMRGTLRITASTLGIVYLYGDLLEAFIASHPGVELIITTTENSIDGARQVLSRAADVAFAAFPIGLPNVATHALGEAEHVLIASPKHPVGRRALLGLDEIRRFSFIRFKKDAGSRQATDRLFSKSGGYPPIALETNDPEFIKRMVLLGLGLAIVPAFTVTRELAEGRIRALKIRERLALQQFGIVYRPDVRMRAIDAFRRFCEGRSLGTLRHFPPETRHRNLR